MDPLGIMRWCMISMLMVFLPSVLSEPIKIDFSTCQPAQYPLNFGANAPLQIVQCCPILPTKPIINGLPPRSTWFTRVRRASQCIDAAYTAKLNKAYELMRALPDSDPRSLTQQWYLHCSYCGGAFLSTNSGTNTTNGVDIHFSWLFFPWHRYFLYFHERILQSLLGDPSFSLNFWNWDAPYSGGACYKVGHNFPAAYCDSSKPTYDNNRSDNAKGLGRLKFPDETFSPVLPATQQPLYNASAQTVINSNLNVMYQAMVSGGTTTETFNGLPIRAGDLRGSPQGGGAGTLESSAHFGVHFWTGMDPLAAIDMGSIAFSARDPVFFAHHANIDRLWQVWTTLGPNHTYYSDPDFLNAEFLFYDENKDLRRVTVDDALKTENLGYVYERADDPWKYLRPTRCSTLTYADLIAQAQAMPVPTRDYDGYYPLQAGTPFIMIVDRPNNSSGAEQFLTIDGIRLDRWTTAGFDIFLNWINPSSDPSPRSCAEYSGRFVNMAQGRRAGNRNQEMVSKQSISKTLDNIQAVQPPSKVVVTLLPFSRWGGYESIRIRSISIVISLVPSHITWTTLSDRDPVSLCFQLNDDSVDSDDGTYFKADSQLLKRLGFLYCTWTTLSDSNPISLCLRLNDDSVDSDDGTLKVDLL